MYDHMRRTANFSDIQFFSSSEQILLVACGMIKNHTRFVFFSWAVSIHDSCFFLGRFQGYPQALCRSQTGFVALSARGRFQVLQKTKATPFVMAFESAGFADIGRQPWC